MKSGLSTKGKEDYSKKLNTEAEGFVGLAKLATYCPKINKTNILKELTASG